MRQYSTRSGNTHHRKPHRMHDDSTVVPGDSVSQAGAYTEEHDESYFTPQNSARFRNTHHREHRRMRDDSTVVPGDSVSQAGAYTEEHDESYFTPQNSALYPKQKKDSTLKEQHDRLRAENRRLQAENQRLKEEKEYTQKRKPPKEQQGSHNFYSQSNTPSTYNRSFLTGFSPEHPQYTHHFAEPNIPDTQHSIPMHGPNPNYPFRYTPTPGLMPNTCCAPPQFFSQSTYTHPLAPPRPMYGQGPNLNTHNAYLAACKDFEYRAKARKARREKQEASDYNGAIIVEEIESDREEKVKTVPLIKAAPYNSEDGSYYRQSRR